MRIMYDSVDSMGIPADAEMVAGYIDGEWPSYGAIVNRFPTAIHVSIATNPAHAAQVMDAETGNGTVPEWVQWIVNRRTAGGDPTVFCIVSVQQELIAALDAQHIPHPWWWISNWSIHAFPSGDRIVAWQYENTPSYDASQVPGAWPGVIPAPAPIPVPPPIPLDDDMILVRLDNDATATDTVPAGFVGTFDGTTCQHVLAGPSWPNLQVKLGAPVLCSVDQITAWLAYTGELVSVPTVGADAPATP